MKITRLQLHDVRRHRDLDLRPAAGLTVIRGPNEAGKSTIQQAIEMVLFRRSTATGEELKALRTWDGADDPRIELGFEHEGREGRLVKTFAGTKGSALLEFDGETEFDPASIEARVMELTGLASEKFFRSTASVRHQELENLDKDESALRDRLQLSMSGADRGTSMAKRRLEEAIRRMRTEGARNPGQLKVARDDLARLHTDLGQGEAALLRLQTDRAAMTVVRDRRVTLDEQQLRDQEAVETSERAVGLATAQAEAQTRYDRYKQAADLRAQVDLAERNHPSTTPLAELRDGVQRINELQFQIEELNSHLESEPDLSDLDTSAIKPPRWQPYALLSILFVLAALVLMGVTAAMTGIGVLPGVGGAILLAMAGLACAFWSWRVIHRSREMRLQYELQENEIQRRLRGRSEEEERLKKTRRDRDALLTKLGIADLSAGEKKLEAETEHVAGIDRLQAELKGLLGAASVDDDVVALRDTAAADIERSKHALAGMGDIGTDPAASKLRSLNALRATQLQRETALVEEGQAQVRVEQNRVDAEQVALLAEAVGLREEHLAVLERRLRIYEATLAAINDAERVTMKKAARYLEQRMGDDVAIITGGRYRRVEVKEADLSFRIWSPERSDWVDARELSKGTIDQLYLAARLGLVRQVTQERQPPLIFDDPFVTFDDERARRAVDLIRTLAADHQVLYLTTSDRYDSVADAVIELAPPTALDILEPLGGAAAAVSRGVAARTEPAPVSSPVAQPSSRAASGTTTATAPASGAATRPTPSPVVASGSPVRRPVVPGSGGAVAAVPGSGGAIAAVPGSGGAIAASPRAGGAIAAVPGSRGAIAAVPGSGGAIAAVPGSGGAVASGPTEPIAARSAGRGTPSDDSDAGRGAPADDTDAGRGAPADDTSAVPAGSGISEADRS